MARKNPVILITGASQGIGEATALVWAKALPQARFILVARSAANLQRVAKRLEKLGVKAVQVEVCDVAETAAVAEMAKRVAAGVGMPDVLINNAGVFRGASFLDFSVEEFDALVAANLRSAFLVSKAFVPAMVQRGSGDVFNMSSIAGLQAYPNGAGYCAAKYGVTGLSAVMRAELKDKGVRVVCVHPGATYTPSWSGSGVAPERLMTAESVAQAMLDAYRLPRTTVIETLVLRPQLGDL